MIGKLHRICYMFCTVILVNLEYEVAADNRRPIYIIGHMTNSIPEVKPYLDEGANVLESDIQFNPDGTVKEMYHGCPGDCFRACWRRDNLEEYLKYLREITDPATENSYSNQLIMQFFDLKLNSSKNLRKSGQDIARHIIDYLWSNGERKQEIRALFYTNEVDKKEAVAGFLQYFKDRNKEHLLGNIGFDGGLQDLSAIGKMYSELGVSNIWLGDGDQNCKALFHKPDRVQAEIDNRNSGGFIKKVYYWTIDLQSYMESFLDRGVDGFITNNPSALVEVLNEPKYRTRLRPATVYDPPFERFNG